MKRFTLKPVFAIFSVLILFAIYLLTCFPIINSTAFRWEDNGGEPENGVQISGNKNIGENNSSKNNGSVGSDGDAASTYDISNDSGSNTDNFGTNNIVNNTGSKSHIITFNFNNPVSPEISDYIVVSITAKNTGQAKYPYGSIAVNLSEENIDLLTSASTGNGADGIVDAESKVVKDSGDNNVKSERAEDIKNDEAGNILDDKALSESNNADSSNTGIKITDGPGTYNIQERARIFVDGMQHNYYIPVGENKYWKHDWNLDGPTLKGQISSLEIEIPKIEGVDIQINSVSLNKRPIFAADSHINYFFKSYFQLSYIDRYLTPAYVFLILFAVAFSLLCFLLKKIGGISNRPADSSFGFKTFAMLVPLLLLIFFSFYFISNYIFTVKGYWDSYKQYIISGRLDETYYGFSDFEKFVTWVGEKVPQGQNIIVLVKGEPIYIMAQMAYGLYPRDLNFMDISRMSANEIADKITSLNFAYEYIVVLSETDKVFLESVKVKLEYSYRENAGFLYKLILK